MENVRAANFLHLFSLGPRLYDLVGLSTDNGAMLTVFVVKHVAGSEPSTQECHEFLKELDAVVSSGKLSLNMPNWREHPDFGCPDCSGNLIMSEDHGKAQYVDFQNFIPRNYEPRGRLHPQSGTGRLAFWEPIPGPPRKVSVPVYS